MGWAWHAAMGTERVRRRGAGGGSLCASRALPCPRCPAAAPRPLPWRPAPGVDEHNGGPAVGRQHKVHRRGQRPRAPVVCIRGASFTEAHRVDDCVLGGAQPQATADRSGGSAKACGQQGESGGPSASSLSSISWAPRLKTKLNVRLTTAEKPLACKSWAVESGVCVSGHAQNPP